MACLTQGPADVRFDVTHMHLSCKHKRAFFLSPTKTPPMEEHRDRHVAALLPMMKAAEMGSCSQSSRVGLKSHNV